MSVVHETPTPTNPPAPSVDPYWAALDKNWTPKWVDDLSAA